MSNPKDFVIENGVLTKYNGPGGDVVIPDGVTTIEGCLFWGCPNLNSIYIPEGVTEIGDQVFWACNNLASITIPESVTSIGRSAFEECASLTSITIPKNVTKIGEDAFNRCINLEKISVEGGNKAYKDNDGVLCNSDGTEIIFCPEGRKDSFTIPHGVVKIGDGAFSNCTSLTNITIPASVRDLGVYAFSGCRKLNKVIMLGNISSIGRAAFCGCEDLHEISLPYGITRLEGSRSWIDAEEGVFEYCRSLEKIFIPDSVNYIEEKVFSSCPSLRFMRLPNHAEIDRYAFSQLTLEKVDCDLNVDYKLPLAYSDLLPFIDLDPDTAASLLIFQTTAQWWPLILKAIELQSIDRNEIIKCLAKKIIDGKKPSKAAEKRITEFIVLYVDYLSAVSIQSVLNALIQKKSKLAEALQNHQEIQNKLLHTEPELPDNLNPIEQLVSENFQMTRELSLLKDCIQKGIPYISSEDFSSKEALLLVLGECLNIPGNTQLDSLKYQENVFEHHFSPIADQIASNLEPNAFMHKLMNLVDTEKCIPAVLAIAQYGTDSALQYLLQKMKAWDSHRTSKICRRNMIICRTALLKIETASAAAYFEKIKHLDLYSGYYHMDSHDLWFRKVLHLGLNKSGEKQYDLGNNKKLQVKVQSDLTVALYNVSTGKTVRSIPKKGTDPDAYQQAHDDLAELKKNLKYAVKHGRDMLLDDFLSGVELSPEQWRERYSGYIAHILAAPLVWEQNRKTFLLSESGLQNQSGENISLQENMPIRLAHPMEMEKDDIISWQKYFTAHDIRQPFLQIWEPLIDFSQVREDRYKEYPIPYNWLRNQEKRGITLHAHFEPMENVTFANATFDNCTANISQPDFGDKLIINSFCPNCHTRRTNHIIAFLDYLTIRQRIERDDVTCADLLPSFTLAQITDFINLATEKGCPNVTALLLNYKNEHFSDFDPMEEFTLGEL